MRRILPRRTRLKMLKLRHTMTAPPLGEIDFGDLGGTEPVCPHFGTLRGEAIDRYYIEAFLAANASDIRGRVLEVATAIYARRYGTGVTQVDELALLPGPGIAFAGDIGVDGLLPSDCFDCIVFTQTLQYAIRPDVALAQLHRALKPGGVLLLTVPCISPLEPGENGWMWNFTPKVTRRLFADVFGPEQCSITAHGNVLAATCFLQGVVQEDLDLARLDPVDECYPVVTCVRAVRQ